MRAASQLRFKVNFIRVPNKIAGGCRTSFPRHAAGKAKGRPLPDRRRGDKLAGAPAVFALPRHLLWLKLPFWLFGSLFIHEPTEELLTKPWTPAS